MRARLCLWVCVRLCVCVCVRVCLCVRVWVCGAVIVTRTCPIGPPVGRALGRWPRQPMAAQRSGTSRAAARHRDPAGEAADLRGASTRLLPVVVLVCRVANINIVLRRTANPVHRELEHQLTATYKMIVC